MTGHLPIISMPYGHWAGGMTSSFHSMDMLHITSVRNTLPHMNSLISRATPEEVKEPIIVSLHSLLLQEGEGF